jgi:hypothetical protein
MTPAIDFEKLLLDALEPLPPDQRRRLVGLTICAFGRSVGRIFTHEERNAMHRAVEQALAARIAARGPMKETRPD